MVMFIPFGSLLPSGPAVIVTRSKTESRVQRRAPGTCGSRRDWSQGVDDHLRIRHVLLHDERVHCGYVHVVTAVISTTGHNHTCSFLRKIYCGSATDACQCAGNQNDW